MQRKNIKNNKGLTLLMLVVTIVVLMILAGISIRVLTGDNGAITKSREAKEATEISREKQLLNLSIVSAVKDDEYATLTEESFEKGLTENIGERDKDYTLSMDNFLEIFRVRYLDSNREYFVDYEGKISEAELPDSNIGYFIKGPIFIYPDAYHDFDEWQNKQLENRTDEELEQMIEEGLVYWYGANYYPSSAEYKTDSKISAFIKYNYDVNVDENITTQEIGPLLGYGSTKEFIIDRKFANPQKYFAEKYGDEMYYVEFNETESCYVNFSKGCARFYFDKPGTYKARIVKLDEYKESVTSISISEQELPFEISDDGVLRISKEYAYYYTQWKTWEIVKNIEIPQEYKGIKVRKLKEALFINAFALESVKLPEGLEEIPKSVFSGCSKIKRIEIPQSVTTIETWAFFGWGQDQTIKVPFKEGEQPNGWRANWNRQC